MLMMDCQATRLVLNVRASSQPYSSQLTVKTVNKTGTYTLTIHHSTEQELPLS